MEFGLFMELSVPRPWTPDSERLGLRERPRAGPPGGRAGLRLHLGRRAPLLGGVLALLGARHLPLGRGHDDQAHPGRTRRRWPACRSTRARSGWPSVPRSSTSSRVGVSSWGPAGLRPGPSLRLRREPRRHQEDMGRVRPRDPEDVDPGTLRLERADVLHARAGRAAQADPEAAPADVGGRDVSGHRDRRRGPGPRLSRAVPRGFRRTRRRRSRTTAGTSPRATPSAPSSTTRC